MKVRVKLEFELIFEHKKGLSKAEVEERVIDYFDLKIKNADPIAYSRMEITEIDDA